MHLKKGFELNVDEYAAGNFSINSRRGVYDLEKEKQ